MTQDIDTLSAEAGDWSILDRIAVEPTRGVPRLRFGHYIDFALQKATSLEIRERMAEVLIDYKRIFASQVTHYLPHNGRKLHPLKGFDYDAYVMGRARTPDNVKDDELRSGTVRLSGCSRPR